MGLMVVASGADGGGQWDWRWWPVGLIVVASGADRGGQWG